MLLFVSVLCVPAWFVRPKIKEHNLKRGCVRGRVSHLSELVTKVRRVLGHRKDGKGLLWRVADKRILGRAYVDGYCLYDL
jgi:hypothetical protein